MQFKACSLLFNSACHILASYLGIKMRSAKIRAAFRRNIVQILLFLATFYLALIIIPYNNLKITQSSSATRQYIFGNLVDTQGGRRLRTFYHRTLLPPGVLVKVKGGLGNQLFQYACAYALAKDLNWPLYFHHTPTPPDSFDRDFYEVSSRKLVLDQFQIPLENLTDDSTRTATRVRYKTDRELLEREFPLEGEEFIALGDESYCLSMQYWRHHQSDIRAMFRPHEWALNLKEIKEMKEKIENSLSVAVHVRRGDFTRIPGYYIPLSYHRRAMRKMVELLKDDKPTFFIFSDDIQFVKEKFKDFESEHELVFVSGGNSSETSIIDEFYLMTLCKHIIVPGSTFSWWVAFLMENPDKIVIASAFHPDYFEVVREAARNEWAEEIYGKMYHPKEWIVLNPFTGGIVKN